MNLNLEAKGRYRRENASQRKILPRGLWDNFCQADQREAVSLKACRALPALKLNCLELCTNEATNCLKPMKPT